MEKEILNQIEMRLKEQGIPKSDFAKEMGCSVRLVHYWFKGERSISIDQADKALRFLGMSFELGSRDDDGRRSPGEIKRGLDEK